MKGEEGTTKNGARWPAARVASLVLVACTACAGGVRPAAPDGAGRAVSGVATTYDTTFYVSARVREDGRLHRRLADSLEYGLYVTRFRERVGPGTDGRFLDAFEAERVDSARFGAGRFVALLRAADAAAAARDEGAVVYVHGYAVSQRRAITQGSDIAHRGSFRGPMIVFSWPAHAALVTWPSPTAIFSRAYRDDAAAARESHAAFRDALERIRAAVRSDALTVLGHSLGAQLVAESLAEPSPARDSLIASPLATLAFFAPDIPAGRFRDTLAAALEPLAARRIVYAAANDLVLGLSRLVNHEPRAGRAGPARTLVPHDVEVVDVTDGLSADGLLRKMFEPHHAMRWSSSALFDFFAVVRGVPAECRDAGGFASRDDDGAWRLLAAPLPPRAPSRAEAACAAQ